MRVAVGQNALIGSETHKAISNDQQEFRETSPRKSKVLPDDDHFPDYVNDAGEIVVETGRIMIPAYQDPRSYDDFYA